MTGDRIFVLVYLLIGQCAITVALHQCGYMNEDIDIPKQGLICCQHTLLLEGYTINPEMNSNLEAGAKFPMSSITWGGLRWEQPPLRTLHSSDG